MTEIVGMCANTPQGHADVISLNPFDRGVFMGNLVQKAEAHFIVLNEFGPSLVQGWKHASGWKIFMGKNNNGPGQRVAGNAVAYDPVVLKIVDDVEFDFNFTDRNGKRRTIHIPVVLFQVKETGEHFAVFLVHVPTRMDASDFKRGWINLRLKAYAKKVSRFGIPVIVAGDRNDGQPEPWWDSGKPTKDGQFFRLVQHQVDWMIGRQPHSGKAGVKLVSKETLEEVYKKASDHKAAILARVKLINAPTVLSRGGQKITLPSTSWRHQKKPKASS